MASKRVSRKKSRLAGKADVVVFQGPDGGYYVRPGVAIIEKKNHQAPMTIRNYASSAATVVLVHSDGTKSITLDDKTKAGRKQTLDLGDLSADAYEYHVYVAGKEAQGNSSPMVIIDE